MPQVYLGFFLKYQFNSYSISVTSQCTIYKTYVHQKVCRIINREILTGIQNPSLNLNNFGCSLKWSLMVFI